MATQFTNFRLSFIWVETIPSILAGKLSPETPYRFLQEPGGYARTFDQLAARQPGPGPLELPWPRPQGHHFWKHYFAGRHAGEVSGADAWRKYVPLRGRLPFTVTCDQPTPKLSFEVFYFPQGVGLIANTYYRGVPRSPLEIAALAHAVRYRYRFKTAGASPKQGLSLPSLVDHALAAVRRQAFGDVEAFPGYQQPFTVATFVQGEADNPDVVDGSDVHRALEALTGWNESFARMDLAKAPVSSAKVTIRSRLDSDLVYAREGGRAIWLPREFAGQPQRARLSCYHRNVTLASLVTMSLGEFVGWVARSLDRGETVLPLLIERAKPAARALDVLAAGNRTDTYRSMSISEQIAGAKWRASIDTVAAA